MVGQGIQTLLTGQNTDINNPVYQIYDYIGSNVFPNVLPQNYKTPAIVYTITDIEPTNIKQYRSIAKTIDLELDIIDDKFSIVSQLTTLVIDYLHRYNNYYNSYTGGSSVGAGIPASASFGAHSMPDTQYIQYVGGLQIVALDFVNSVEEYDEVLELYRNTLSFKLTYIEDVTTLGADIAIKLQDLFLMSSNSQPPITINGNKKRLNTPSVTTKGNNNINSASSLEGVYLRFRSHAPSFLPIIKQSNSINYIDFITNAALTYYNDINPSDNRYYKQATLFTLFGGFSNTATKGAAICYKTNYDTNVTGGLSVKSVNTGGATGITTFYIILTLKTTSAPYYNSYVIFSVVKWVAAGLNVNLNFNDPVYFAVTFKKLNVLEVSINYDIITKSDLSLYGNTNVYSDTTTISSGGFSDDLFNFHSLHSDITSFDSNGTTSGTYDLNDPVDIYEFSVFPKFIDFGSGEYLEIKKSIINKHGLG